MHEELGREGFQHAVDIQFSLPLHACRIHTEKIANGSQMTLEHLPTSHKHEQGVKSLRLCELGCFLAQMFHCQKTR